MEQDKNGEVYTKVVRAGKRTYFFDVKSTKGNDLYITLTESKKTHFNDGRENYEKHKIFLYKEDFEKFREGLEDVLNKIDSLRGADDLDGKSDDSSTYSSVSFDDL